MFGRLFDKGFSLEAIDKGHHEVTYRGVPAIKCPFDYVIYQMIISEVRPDLIIEIGTRAGGSALYLADLLQLNGNGELHTIDLPGNTEDRILHDHARIRVFKDGFANYDTNLIAGHKNVMVIDDGSHRYDDCRAALEKFSPFVTPGSYFVVEDGIIDRLGRKADFNGGPLRAIREFLSTHNDFTIDRHYCDFFGTNATFNVDGYLKKLAG